MACGVIVEYNPFHNGHLHHLQEAKKIGGSVVAVMSGNHVQRGEPAICHKQQRTEMALRCGADIVLELPVYYATASAEYFAAGAIATLAASGVCDSICFGSESGDIDALQKTAKLLDAPLPDGMEDELKKGLSWPAARSSALRAVGGLELTQPNDILAVEYLRAISKQHASLIPYTIPRAGGGYSSTDINTALPSALAIRKAILSNHEIPGHGMPSQATDILRRSPLNTGLDNYSEMLHYILATATREQLGNILDISEGLENRIIDCARNHFLLSDLAAAVKTKRYTLTRIKRVLLHILLGITHSDMQRLYRSGIVHYVRILGFRRNSEDLLRQIIKCAGIPVITNLKNADAILTPSGRLMLDKELYSSRLYDIALRSQNPSLHITPEENRPMVIV